MQIDGNDLKSEMEKFHQTEKDLLKRREHGIETEDAAEDLIRRKVNEAKRWNKFMVFE